MSPAEATAYSAMVTARASVTLSACAKVAKSLGDLAEHGRQFSLPENVADQFIGAVQVGEFLMTGGIPSKDSVIAVLAITETPSPEETQ